MYFCNCLYINTLYFKLMKCDSPAQETHYKLPQFVEIT